MSLKELQDSVAFDAALHHPDIIYDPVGSNHNMYFSVVPMRELIDEREQDIVGLTIETDLADPSSYNSRSHMLTKWSRHQLLAFFGVREKWFSFVELDRQAEELNARVSALSGYCVRTMRPYDDDFPVHVVRGLVSAEYVDIPNTAIMEAVVARMPPDSVALRYASGITDRSFYAYVMSPNLIGIPGTKFHAHPTVLIRNSEVGHTSLSVTPALVNANGQPIVAKEHMMLRKVHRGRDLDLRKLFEAAFAKCATLWEGMAEKIPLLVSKTYTFADGVVVLQRMLHRAEAKKEFIFACEQHMKKTFHANTTITALDLVETITEVASGYTDRDENYEISAIAGAVLFRLVLT